MNTSCTQVLNQGMQSIGAYAQSSPKLMGAFMKLHEAGASEGALSVKQKELIALGIGISARCEGCILAHVDAALKAGASHDEVVEAIDVAVYMGGGPSVVYGSKAFAALQELESAD